MDEEASAECITLSDRLNADKSRGNDESLTESNGAQKDDEEKFELSTDTTEHETNADMNTVGAKKEGRETNLEHGRKTSEDEERANVDSLETDHSNGQSVSESNKHPNMDLSACDNVDKDNGGAEQTVPVSDTDNSTMNKSCDNFVDSNETVDDSGSEESGSEDEYESAEEGEEIQADTQTLRELEESLTEEEKEEKRKSAQVLKDEGNDYFRNGSYKTAIKTYSRALRTCPLKYQKDRAIMYSNRAACKMKLEDYESAIKDCSRAVDLHPHYLKALMRRAELYEKTEKLDEALADFQKLLELDPSQHAARAACARLPDMIKERNEKMKEEMMGKLKDLGNMVLRPFGLSTNNFKLNQDPNSGGYSINFVQSPDQNS